MILPNPVAAAEGHGAAPGPVAARQADAAAETVAQRTVLSLALLVLAGILVIGVGLIALVMLLGRRYRRVARQPLPRVAPVDPLFYLKPKPAPAGGEEPRAAPPTGNEPA